MDLEWIVKSACRELENKQGGALNNVSVREFFTAGTSTLRQIKNVVSLWCHCWSHDEYN